ncbi:hypothetical protein Adeg_0769 [Ammonifex degensii KC4]|uniref:Vitamin K epoxide reductase n=1 Tax=Ammonifex degensii (strain DSM 10501 / KC4) TaxID=429009 RepID=C9RCD7_AMMDK|nr:hypothetical protein [Ammonifex degensii]ACX51914.1 hypothetical protein Adeg_0769 [Ammonifex degensii KC4]
MRTLLIKAFLCPVFLLPAVLTRGQALWLPVLLVSLASAGLLFTSFWGWASVLASAAACASFSMQAVLGFCPSCFAGAALFLAGAFLAAVGAPAGKQRAAALLCLFLPVLALGWLSRTVPPGVPGEAGVLPVAGGSVREESRAAPTTDRASPGPGSSPEGAPPPGGKVELYFSPSCPACGEAVLEAARADPEGERWVPVVVPGTAFHLGEEELARAGYRGAVRRDARSPCGHVPCFFLDGRPVAREEALSFVRQGRPEP